MGRPLWLISAPHAAGRERPNFRIGSKLTLSVPGLSGVIK